MPGGEGAPAARDLLAELPIAQLPDRIVQLAKEIAGCQLALYVADIDGSRLHRVAGTNHSLPDELPAPGWFVGPELSAIDVVKLKDTLPKWPASAAIQPLWLRGRAVALLLCEHEPRASLADFAGDAALAIELAENYTDVFASARRRRHLDAGSEIQQALLPPRIMPVAGAQIAGTILPAYNMAGDWFDYATRDGGADLAIGDAAGKGPSAAALSALAVGAYRAARRNRLTLAETVNEVHETILRAGAGRMFMTAIIARWDANTATFSWIRCGHLEPLLWHPDGSIETLRQSNGALLGTTIIKPAGQLAQRTLTAGERIILLSDGVTERRSSDNQLLGIDGIAAALRQARRGAATSTVAAITAALTQATTDPLHDDATIVVLQPRPT